MSHSAMPESGAPRCLRPGCAHAVRPVAPGQRHLYSYVREVGGRYWRRYCSRSCAALVAAASVRGTRTRGTEIMMARNRAAYLVRVRARLRTDAEPLAEQTGASLDVLIKFGWACEKRGYQRGFAAAWMQRRRKLLGLVS